MRDCRMWRSWLLSMLSLACLSLGASRADEAKSVYESDLKAFLEHVDKNYPFFSLKNIGSDWARAKDELGQRAKNCKSDEEFLRIILDAIRVLRDEHMGIRQSRARIPMPPPRYYPGVSFLPATEGRVVVMYAPEALAGTLTTGTVVTTIDGTDARRYLDQRALATWNQGGFFSSPQRARLFEYRQALRGDQGQKHTIGYQEDGKERSLTLQCNTVARGWPHTYNLPSDLKRAGNSFFYAKLASDVGYMYLRRVDGSVSSGIEEALKTHPHLKGWILDLRGNGGGGYDNQLIETVKRIPRPVAVLTDAGCVSAGETLARDLQTQANARVFGSKTAGASSAKSTWSFPSGIASITLAVRSRWRDDKKPIELNGIDPDVEVEAVPGELKAGKNSAILRAEEYITREAQRRDKKEGDPANNQVPADS